MTEITKTMLAAPVEDVDKEIKYPVGATYKLDGIRALKPKAGAMLSRSFKPIANKHINKVLSEIIPVGMDGETMAGKTFQAVTSAVMTHDGTPQFEYWIFDYVKDSIKKPYMERMDDLAAWYEEEGKKHPFIKILLPKIIHNKEELLAFEAEALAAGFEGVILRKLDGPYKNGRSTIREGYLLKLKQFCDSEAIVTEFEELMINDNDPTINELGYQERSSHQENLRPGNTLGALWATDVHTGVSFKIGTGFDAAMRKEIWMNPQKYLNTIVKYKYFPVSIKDKPRHPVFLGFRHKDDM